MQREGLSLLPVTREVSRAMIEVATMKKEKQRKGRRKENMYYFPLERNVEGFSWANSNYKRALRTMIRICRVTMCLF